MNDFTRGEQSVAKPVIDIDQEYKYGFSDPGGVRFQVRQRLVAGAGGRDFRDEGRAGLDDRTFACGRLETFFKKPMPTWGADLSGVDLDNIHYYVRPAERKGRTWDEVPEYIKETFDRLGIPEAERKFLAGVSAQYESEVVYHSMREDLAEQGVIFLDMDSGFREHPDIVKKYFGTVVPPSDNKFAALNSAVWSGGSFIYVPPGVRVEIPLQAYFRINAENMGQFERTLIIADEGSFVHYVEGCTAPIYSTDSLHAAVVEIIALKNSRVRYTTIQNWSTNVYNLVTKRAVAYEGATMEWVDGNIGSKTTMKYPAIFLMGEGARAKCCPSPSRAKASTRTPGRKSSTMRPTRPPSSRPSPFPRAAARPPIAGSSGSTPTPRGPRARWTATRCCSTTTPRRKPFRTWTFCRRTFPSSTRPPSAKWPRTSCST